jgi:hypothetical protein
MVPKSVWQTTRDKRLPTERSRGSLHVANLRVQPSSGFANSNKVSISLRLNHREWLTQCKIAYYYEKKTRINLVDFDLKMEQVIMKTIIKSN